MTLGGARAFFSRLKGLTIGLWDEFELVCAGHHHVVFAPSDAGAAAVDLPRSRDFFHIPESFGICSASVASCAHLYASDDAR